MRYRYLWFLVLVLIVSCKTDNKSKITSDTKKYNVSVSTQQTEDDIQVNTIQIGGETNQEKDNFQASYPQTKYEFINDIEKSQVAKFQQEFEKEAKKTTDKALSGITFGSHFEIIHNDENIMGFLYETYRSFGNTYTDEYQTNYYDLRDETPLKISDFFQSPEAFNSFATEVKDETSSVLKAMVDNDNSLNKADKKLMFDSLKEQIEEGTAPKEDNYPAVIFKPESIEVIFNKYQVAPGNMGSVRVKVPAKDVSQLFKEKYQSLFHLEQKPVEKKEEEKNETRDSQTSIDIPATSSVDCGKVPCVALTFDDGPSVYTNQLLDILKSENVKASFFVLGKSAKVQPKTILRQKNEGHLVANHSWNHKQLNKLSKDDIIQQIQGTNQAINAITGEKVKYLRPPYGAMNSEVKQLSNLPIILWSLDPLDWKDRKAEIVAKRMIEAKANGIILAHDIHKSTVEAMPEVIKTLKDKGFHLVTLDELYAGITLEKGKVYNKR